MRHGRKFCPCVGGWEVCCQLSQGKFWGACRVGCCSSLGQDVLTERLLLTGAYSRKHFKAFLKLITCFPELGLVCCDGLALAPGGLSAAGWPVRLLPEHTPVAQGMKGTDLWRGAGSYLGPLLSKFPVFLLQTPSPEETKQDLAPLHTPACRGTGVQGELWSMQPFLEGFGGYDKLLMGTKSYPSQGFI